MGEKKINFWKIIKGIKRQSIRMQQRLIVYWCVVILTLFLVTVLLLSILGVLPGMDFKVREMLSAQQKNTLSTMTEQTDIMMARSISLSEDITKELNQCLTANGKTFSNLNDNPQLIMDLEAALYPSLKSALDVKYCSGVFVVLDATVNTKTEYADTSRMGIYLRLSDLKAVNTSKQHVVFFRGNADIARAEQVQLHNRWNLEFDTSALSGYEQIMQFDGNRLVESCLWTDRLELSDTWEDVQLLYVPVLDSTGKVRGLCGMEMSNLYFRLSYPMVEGSCGNIVTVLAPVDKKGNIYLDKAMFGDTKETYLSPSGTMTVKKGKYYNTYSTAFGNYIGRHELLAGSMAVEDEGTKIVVYDYDGNQLLKLGGEDISSPDKLGSITGMAETENGFVAADGNMREIQFWAKDGTHVGAISTEDIFGVSYPWLEDMQLLDDGSLLIMLTQERDDGSANELMFFRLTGF